MPVRMGKEGYVYSGTTASATSALISIDSWAIDEAADAIEVTAFGTGTAISAKSFDYGLKSATGSMSGNYDADCSHLENIINLLAAGTPTNVSCEFHVTATEYFSCAVLITGVGMSSPVADKVTVTINFTVDGALTWN